MDYIITLSRCPRELGQAERGKLVLDIAAALEQMGVPETIVLLQLQPEPQPKPEPEVSHGPQD